MSIPHSVKWDCVKPYEEDSRSCFIFGGYRLPEPKRETIRITSKAGWQWMFEAMENRELIRRRGAEYLVVKIADGTTAELEEVIRVHMPSHQEIPRPGFYY